MNKNESKYGKNEINNDPHPLKQEVMGSTNQFIGLTNGTHYCSCGAYSEIKGHWPHKPVQHRFKY